jgi:hypothetical protein
LLPASFWFLAWLTLQPEDGGDIFFQNVVTVTGIHGDISQKTELFRKESKGKVKVFSVLDNLRVI